MQQLDIASFRTPPAPVAPSSATAQRLVPVTARGLLGAEATPWAVTIVYRVKDPGCAATPYGDPFVTVGADDRVATPGERRDVLGSFGVQTALAILAREQCAPEVPWRMALCEDPRHPGVPFVLEGDSAGVFAVNGLELDANALDDVGLPGGLTLADLNCVWTHAAGGL